MGRYSVASNIEFISGFPQKIGGFISLLSAGAMIGVPRAIKTWRDINGIIRIIIGTGSHLYTCLADGTSLTDITPRNMVWRGVTTLSGSSTFPMTYATTLNNFNATITFGSGTTAQALAVAAMANGDYVGFSWDAATATATGMAFQGYYQISGVSGSSFVIANPNSAATVTTSGTANCNIVLLKTSLASNAFASVNGSPTVTVTVPAAYTAGWDINGIPTTCGLYVTISGATTFNGILATWLNGEHLLTPIVGNATQFTITSPNNATGTGSGGGSSAVVSYTPPMTQYFTSPQPSGALTFTQQALPTSRNWSALCYGSSGFVAVSTGTSNNAAISTNGVTWTNTTLSSAQNWSAVCYGNSIYLALVAGSSTTSYSSDGVNWTAGTLPSATGVYITPGNGSFTDSSGNVYTITAGGVAEQNGVPIPADPNGHQAGEYYNGIIYFQSAVGIQWYSWNGTWTACSPPPTVIPSVANWSGVAYGAGVFVAVAASVNGAPNGIGVYSASGTSWTQVTNLPANPWKCIAYNGSSVFVAICGGATSSGQAASSVDGINWSSRGMPSSQYWQSVAWGANTFCAVSGGASAASTVAATSPDGFTWTARAMPVSANWTSITYGQGLFVAVAGGGSANTTVALSPDGINWTIKALPTSANWSYTAYGAGVIAVLASSSTIAATSQIVVAQAAPSILPVGWNLAAYGGLMVASPIGGTIYFYDPVAGGRAYPVSNSPGHCCGMFVTPERMIVALGAKQGTVTDTPQIIENIISAGSNMTVAWCDQSDPTQWTSETANTAQTGRTLQGGNFFVGGIAVRDGTSLIFTDRCCFAMTYSGDYLVYDTPLLADNAGLVSPYAVAAEGGVAIWLNDCDLYSWNGSVAAVATDDVRTAIFGNLNKSYLYKAVAGFNRLKKQVRFWCPSTLSSTENDGCLIFQTDSLVFSTSTIARTGWTDSNLGAVPYSVDSLGNLYQEETGVDANGQPLVATLTFSPTDISNSDRACDMFGFTPDFRNQVGNLTLSINTQYYPQDPITVSGPFTITTDDTNPTIDLRCDGNLIGWTVVSNTLGGNFRMGLCRVNFNPSGIRN